MDYDGLCQQALKSDKSIRFCGIANAKGELVAGENQNPEEKLLNNDETKMSIHYTLDRWRKTSNLSHKIGKERSAMVEYDMVTMITIPVNKTELFLVSMEPNTDYHKIINSMYEILKEFSD